MTRRAASPSKRSGFGVQGSGLLPPARSPESRATVKVGPITIGPGEPLVLIAGPDVIESERHLLSHAERIATMCERAGVSYIVKCSYDKANRTSGRSFRGLGLSEGLKILSKVKQTLGVPVLSDVHCREEVGPAAEVLDVLQVPAFLCRQTDFVTAVAKSGKPMNVKKGQFLAPWDMRHVIEKARAAGNRSVLVTERGASFGYNNLVSDFRSLQVLAGFGCPVIYDGTHSVQLPGGLGHASGGQREFIPALVRAAVATGFCHGIFLEVHEDPDHAPVDGPNMLRLADLPQLLEEVQAIRSSLNSSDVRRQKAEGSRQKTQRVVQAP
ncbi:MAG: 3-deoxy-8-phosphooctulonate synthase [Candidatus Omnitrophica bacterium]|nr:3-deoxy-8-phosphooctulonate synthase [Candidatus Omnitrophota bacterium]